MRFTTRSNYINVRYVPDAFGHELPHDGDEREDMEMTDEGCTSDKT